MANSIETRFEIEIPRNLQQQIAALSNTVVEHVIRNNGFDRTDVSVSIVGSQKIRALKRKYFEVDRATDVIAFPMETAPEFPGERIVLGDIVISLERARVQAREAKHGLIRELALLLLHGTLHLLGHDDTSPTARTTMFDLQARYMKEIDLSKIECGKTVL